jgi:hypothetical protein
LRGNKNAPQAQEEKTMNKKLIGALLAIGVMAGLCTSADADMVPGFECKPVSPQNAASTWHGNGNLINWSETTTIEYACPLPKEGILSITAMRVFVIDQNFYENVSCVLYSKNPLAPYASGVWYGRSTIGTSPNPQTLSITSVNTFGQDRYAYLSCMLPKRYNGLASVLLAYDYGQRAL